MNGKAARIIKLVISLVVAVIYVIRVFPMIKMLKVEKRFDALGNSFMNLFQFIIILIFVFLLLWMAYQAMMLCFAILGKEDSPLGIVLLQLGELGVTCLKELISIFGSFIFAGLGVVAMTISPDKTNDVMTARIVGGLFVAAGLFLCISSVRKIIPEVKDSIAIIKKTKK